MNIGNIVTRSLKRAKLSVSDVEMREMATELLDEIIQEWWEQKFWNFRKSVFSYTTADGIDEYAPHKLFGGASTVIPNTMRGSDPVRRIRFEPSSEFYRKHAHDIEESEPYWFRDGQVRGFQTNVSASSQIKFVSSLSNYTTGTVNVIYGSQRVVVTTGAVTIDMLGRWFRVGTDAKRYKITKIESSTVFLINSPYEGTTNATATYAIGDVQQKGIVLGVLDNGTVAEEEVQLNGENAVSTVNSFQQLIRIGKSDKTGGHVTASSNGDVITNAVLDPGETEVEYHSIKLYPIPSGIELITFEAYMKHPHLYRQTDSPLIPSEFHQLLVLELFIRLQTEWNNTDVSEETLRRRDKMLVDMETRDNNTDNWGISQETEEETDRNHFTTNLPASYDNEE